MALQHDSLTSTIIGAFYDVYNALGYGYLENVYSNAMAVALGERNVPIEREKLLDVHFHGARVGQYRADLICDRRVLVEMKAGAGLPQAAFRQTLNYLRATNLPVGLLLFFGPRPMIQRVVTRSSDC